MKLSYNAVWDRTLALLGAHAPLIGAIAGVFIFLPSLLVGYFYPVPQGDASDPEANVELLGTYFASTWHWQLLALLVTVVGILAILILVLDRSRPTVGAAIASATKLMPFYLLASFIVAVVVFLAAILAVLPFALLAATGITVFNLLGSVAAIVLFGYCWGRVSIIAAVAGLEKPTPLGMIKRTLELTRGHGWSILGLVLLILLAGGIASLAVVFVIGGLLHLLLGAELAEFLVLIVGGAINSALAALLVVTTGSIYTELSGGETTASLFN